MQESIAACPKCSSKMVEGFVADYAEKNVRYARWYQGNPDSALFWEIDPRSNPKWKLKGRRCENCGFVEFFATDTG